MQHLNRLRRRRLTAFVATGALALGLLAGVGLSSASAAPAGWVAEDAQKRMRVTVDGDTLTGNVADFPVLVRLSPATFDYASADPEHLLFVAGDDASPLAYEVETWNPGGESVVWVKVPQVGPDAVTVDLYYDGAPAATLAAAEVWDADFQAVHHFEEASGDLTDSTSNGFDGTPAGGPTYAQIGRSGSALALDGANDWVDLGRELAAENTAMTVSGDFYVTPAAISQSFVRIGARDMTGGVQPGEQFAIGLNGGKPAAQFVVGGVTKPFNHTSAATVGWHNLTATYDGSAIVLYVDGAQVGSTPASGALADGGEVDFAVGAYSNPTHFGPISLDELRVSDTARSADWVAAEQLSRTGALAVASPTVTQDGGEPTTGWAVPGATQRVPLTVSADALTGPVTDFPVSVRLTPQNFSYTDAEPDRLVFTDGVDPTPLPYEVESWNPAGDSIVWVKVPQVGPSPSTVDLYFGGGTPVTTVDAADVWDASFQAVHHFEEEAGAITDSTANGFDGTAAGGPAYAQAGRTGGALALDGSDDLVNLGKQLGATNTRMTVSGDLYVSPAALMTTYVRIGARDISGGVKPGEQFAVGLNSARPVGQFVINGATKIALSPGVTSVGWHNITTMYDGSEVSLYVDGELTSSVAASGPLDDGSLADFTIGAYSNAALFGEISIDELRVSEIARSADWMLAEQLARTDELVELGPIQSQDGSVTLSISSPRPGANLTGGSVELTGTVSGTATVTYVLDGGEPVSLGEVQRDFATTLTGLSSGAHTFEVTARVDDENIDTKTITFDMDGSIIVTLMAPVGGATLPGDEVAVSGSVSTPATVTYTVDDGEEVSLGAITSEFTATLPGLSSGLHTLDVTAVVDENNVDTVQVTFNADSTGPEITFNTPAQGATYEKEPITVDVVAEDAAGIDSFVLLLDDTTQVENGDVLSPDELPDGPHTLTATAVDMLGQESVQTVEFRTIGNYPSVPSLPVPADDTTDVAPENVALGVTVADASGDPLDVAVKWARTSTGADAIRTGSSQEAMPERTAGENSDSTAIGAKDGSQLTTPADGAYPFQQFDVEVPADLGAATFTVDWAGEVPEGQRAALSVWNYTTQSWELLADGEGGQDLDLSGKATVEDSVRRGLARVMVQDVAKAVIDDDDVATIAWITDTQFYSEREPNTYQKMTDWAVDHREAKDIGYGIHTGDIVQNANVGDEWARASQIMRTWDDAGLPYGIVPGNHDIGSSNYASYRSNFGERRFADNPWYGGTVDDNIQHYDLISTPEAEYLMLYLDWSLSDDEVDWANEVIASHPDHNVVISVHEYIGAGGAYSGPGSRIFNEIVLPNKNVDLVLCGHIHTTAYNVKHLDDDRVVVEVLYDTQNLPTAGGGWMRTIDLDATNQTMTQTSFSVLTDGNNAFGDPSRENFTTELAIDTPSRSIATDFLEVSARSTKPIGRVLDAPSGSAVTIQAGDLEPNTTYEWFAEATDMDGYRTTSPTWSFTTGDAATTEPVATTVTADDVTVAEGKPLTLAAQISPAAATGPVDFVVKGQVWCSATLTGGNATCEPATAPEPGAYAVVARYAGDSGHLGAQTAFALGVTAEVDEPAHPGEPADPGEASDRAEPVVTTVAATSFSSTYGRSPALTATVSPATATGTVRFQVGATVWCTATVSGGEARCTPSGMPAPGSYAVRAVYSGDAAHAGDQTAVLLSVAKATSATKVAVKPGKVTGHTKAVVQIRVTGADGIAASGKVRVTVAGKVRTLTLRQGRATVTLAEFRTPGKRKVKVVYAGSTHVQASSASTQIKVVRR